MLDALGPLAVNLFVLFINALVIGLVLSCPAWLIGAFNGRASPNMNIPRAASHIYLLFTAWVVAAFVFTIGLAFVLLWTMPTLVRVAGGVVAGLTLLLMWATAFYIGHITMASIKKRHAARAQAETPLGYIQGTEPETQGYQEAEPATLDELESLEGTDYSDPHRNP